ncbi:MAG TPA: M1 family metallopeptidase, partial [Candidatus Saccharimonadales bacterium]|nr:M1 family metallopeptidase [Candidatus Saccharimonadales bacterium]
MQTVKRLIEGFIPSSYELKLNINRKKRTFTGTVVLKGSSPRKSDEIVLHSKDLDIGSVLLDGRSANFSFGNYDTLVVKDDEIAADKHSLVISFSGKISETLHGMYPCYFEHDGIKKELVATQFESHYAREAFPCIDEPEAKATFDVTLITDADQTVLGNMPVKEQRNQDKQLVTTFETTPIMSTYLLAWVIGEMHRKTATTKRGIEVSVWATPAQPANSLDFPLDIAVRSIDFFEDYFGTNYPLTKCDNVALPDFSYGAMENWGLLTYREIAILADPKTTSISNKQYAATVVAHEISHQWFGNLVTMKWWNDLWLNESFATLIEYVATDALQPDWNIWMDFACFESTSALRRDSLAGVQPVQTEVNHPDEIGTLFDGAIVYAKGARLMKMMKRYIGDDAFRLGLAKYFKEYAYKNTEASDLWRVLSKESNKDIGAFMTKWISKPGFPVLHVVRDDNKIKLSQERLSNGLNGHDDSLWPIPLNSNYQEMPEIFDTKDLIVEVTGSDPIRFNIGNDAHFITHYESKLLDELIDEVKSGKLNPLDRLQLLNEQLILTNSGVIPSAELIPLIRAYKDETAEPVWNVISMAISELKKFIENDEKAEMKLRHLAGSMAKNQFARLGWDEKKNETEEDTKLRSTILGLMIYSEDKSALDYAAKLYESVPIEELNPELRGIVISSVIRQKNDIDMVKKLLSQYEKTSSSELKLDINIGVTATKDEEIIDLLLGKIKDTSFIRIQDTARWIAYLIRNKFGRQKTWEWVRNNWDWINTTFGGDKSYDDYPRYTANALSTQKQLDEYIEFFGNLRSDPSLTRVIDMGINEITNRVKI